MITIEQLKQLGGATLNKDCSIAEINSGYAVSLSGCETQISLNLASDDLLHALLALYTEGAYSNNCYIGLWVDADKLYVDLSVIYDDIERAVVIGLANKQKAIYDFSAKQAVFIRE